MRWRKGKYHKLWFAWRPVPLFARDEYVWLEWVDRQWSVGRVAWIYFSCDEA